MNAPVADAGRGDVGSVPGPVSWAGPGTANRDCVCGYPLVQRGDVVLCAVYGARHHHERRRPYKPRPRRAVAHRPTPLPIPGTLARPEPGDLPLPSHVPFADLADWVARNTARPLHLGVVGWIARLADTHRRTVWRWQQAGVLRFEIADEVASRLGVNPATVWGDMWWASMEPAA